MSKSPNRRDLISALSSLVFLSPADTTAFANRPTVAARATQPQAWFVSALKNWRRAWQDYAAIDGTNAADRQARRATEEAMDALLDRITAMEAAISQVPARNLAELRIKIEMLSVDGEIRLEFQESVIDDVISLTATSIIACRYDEC